MASNVLNDWAWRPDQVAQAALKRGEAKEKERRRAAREDLLNFNLVQAARKKSKKSLREADKARTDVFAYLFRVSPQGRMRGKSMSWATLLYFMMSETKALGRYKTKEEAQKAIEGFKGSTSYDSFYIVTPDEDIRHFDNNVLDGIFKQFGDPRMGLKKEQRQEAARYYCSIFDKNRHGADGTLLKPYKPAPIQGQKEMESATTVSGTSKGGKKGKSTPVKGGKKGKAAPAKTKKALKADGKAAKTKAAPKEGVTARADRPAAVICDAINTGKSIEAVTEMAKKRFPDNPINRTYVLWYGRKLAKDGKLTPAGKKVLEAATQKS